MDFGVPAYKKGKIKKNAKRETNTWASLKNKKEVDCRGDGDYNCSVLGAVPKCEKNTRDLRRLAVTQTPEKDIQQTQI